ADLRRAVRVGGRLQQLQAAGERTRAGVCRPLRADRVRLESRLQLPLVPHHERAALGVQARLGALRRLAAGALRGVRLRELPVRTRFRRDVLGPRAQRVPRQDELLDQPMTRAGPEGPAYGPGVRSA